jgi:hypothetical protein
MTLFRLATLTVLLMLFGITLTHADVLNINSVGTKSGKFSATDRPSRGMSKAQVAKTYGEPIKKIAPVGKNAKRRMHHAISRWIYKDYMVVFAEDYVVDTITRK